jgi:excisionase family DNA binding protein
MHEVSDSQVGMESGGSELDLLLAPEVAQRARMTTPWIWAQPRANKIPHVRFGRHVRYRREEIDAWIAEHERGSLIPVAGGGGQEVAGGLDGRRV